MDLDLWITKVKEGQHLSEDELQLLCEYVNLVDWLKMMVGSRRSEEVVDPTIDTKPSTRALKRALLTALRCVDPDSNKRPRMSQVVRMLESEEYPLPREDRRRRSQAGSMEVESHKENYDTDKSDNPDLHSDSKRNFRP